MSKVTAILAYVWNGSSKIPSDRAIDDIETLLGRLSLIVTRSQLLLDRFEHRLTVAAGIESCGYNVKLGRAREVVCRLEHLLETLLECSNATSGASATRLVSKSLSKLPVYKEDAPTPELEKQVRASIDQCANYLENLLHLLNKDVESEIKKHYRLRVAFPCTGNAVTDLAAYLPSAD